MNRDRLRIIGATTLVAFVLAGAAVPMVAQSDSDWKAPPAAAAKKNPLAGRQDVAVGGGKLFEQRCATCHGAEARGSEKAPNLLDRDVQAQSDGELYWKISSGNARAGMPTFSFLPSAQRWQLVLHLRTLAAPK